MSISKEELTKEKQNLKNTLKVIKELVDKNSDNIDEQINSINEMKKYIWENNTVLDDAEIASNMYEVNCNVGVTNKNISDLQKLKKSLLSPYFGRIDFNSDDFLETVYIGLNGISKDLKFYVFDWRTPIASLFYNYGIGNASYEAPVGKIDGEITLKRQYKIENGKLVRCFNSDLNIDDEYLQEILASSSSDKMTNIVNTIQQEQNAIIRNIKDKYLIVQGIAGSGKTSVALHRIAYLLYKEKDLNSNNILIFSPNDVFSEYISNVLPELGEDNVLQTTFSDFAGSYIKKYKKIESFTEFIDRYYGHEKINDDDYKVIKYKLSDEYKKLLDSMIKEYKDNLFFIKPLMLNDKIFSVDKLDSLFKDRYSRLPLNERLEYIAEMICDNNNISFKKYGKTIQLKLRSLLSNDLNIEELYFKIISSEDFRKNANIEQVNIDSQTKVLKYEDLLGMMYINFELNGYPRNNGIKHVVIDEAQDYNLLQFTILKKIFSSSSFTILGDINQTINPYYRYNSLSDVNNIFENRGNCIELNKTYRSSQEIIDFTNQILNLNNACSVRKSNSIPVNFKSVNNKDLIHNILDDIKSMKEEGIKRIAIITKENIETNNLYKLLKNDINNLVLLGQMQNDKISDIVILPSYLSKGLEFDGVIAFVDSKNQYQEKDNYLFYVVCTRAQHALTIYNQDVKKLTKKI